MPFKFGKKPAKRSRRALPLSNYLHMNAIAYPPVQAWERPIQLGMLGNDSVGDCTIAGHYHLRMIQRAVAQAGNPLVVTTEQALADYSAATGYNPADPSTDQGANLGDILKFYGDKYVTIDVANIDQVKAANFIFGGLYIGFIVPQSMVDEMNICQTTRHPVKVIALTLAATAAQASLPRHGESIIAPHGIFGSRGLMRLMRLWTQIG
jgi:hypothetical protein